MALILFAILINTGCTYLWGYHTIVGSDEIRNYDRAMQISLHRVAIDKVWDSPNVYALYPAGLHLLISSFMLTSGDFNVFDISFIFKILFTLIPTLLSFLIGLKINKWVAIFSTFFYITSFLVFTSTKTHYIYLFNRSNSVVAGCITIIMLFILLLSFLISLRIKRQCSLIAISSIYVLASTAHGITHISTFIGQLFNFSFLFGFLIFYGFIRHKEDLKNKSSLFLFLTFLSALFTFLIYYFPMYSTITGPDYKIDRFFPSILPTFLIDKIPMVFVSIVVVSIVLYVFLIKFHTKAILLTKGRYTVLGITSLYIFLYLYILMAVTKNPNDYAYSFVLIFSPFPTYLSRHMASFISIYSLLAGFSIYVLSIFGVLFSIKKFGIEKVIGYTYMIFFFTWFIFGFIIMYYASRIIYIQYFLPFVLGVGAYYFLKMKNRTVSTHTHINFIKIAMVILLVLILISVSTTTVINKDPAIRDEKNINNPLRIGTVSSQWATYGFIVYVKNNLYSSEYMLGSTNSIETLSATTYAKPPVIDWVGYYKNHTHWAVTMDVLRNPSKQNLQAFYNTYYPTRYFVTSYEEHFDWGPPMPVKKYDNSPYLLKTYQSNGGQRMYLIVF